MHFGQYIHDFDPDVKQFIRKLENIINLKQSLNLIKLDYYIL